MRRRDFVKFASLLPLVNTKIEMEEVRAENLARARKNVVGPKVSIVIVHRNRPEYLNLCLQSIASLTPGIKEHEIIVVDNDSQAPTGDFLKVLQEEDIKVVRCRENFYWCKAANLGARVADPRSKYLLFLHHDNVVLQPSWLDCILNVAEVHETGMVGLTLQSYYFNREACQFLNENCLLVRRDLWRELKGFPEELPIIGGAFILTLMGHKINARPQAIKTEGSKKLLHHYHNFSYDMDVHSRAQHEAMEKIPTLLNTLNLAKPA